MSGTASDNRAGQTRRRRGAPDRGTRERILRATLQVIKEGGIAAVRNGRVAELAGASPGSLTYLFANQGEFLRDALLLYTTEEAARMKQAALTLRTGGLTLEQVAVMLEAMISETLANAEVGAQFDLYLQATRDPELRAAAAAAFTAYDEVAVAALTAAGIPEPERHAPALVAISDGLTLRHLALGNTRAHGIASAYLTYIAGARITADSQVSPKSGLS